MLFSYEPMMVVASVLVAIMASFTGLRLAGDLSALPIPARRIRIAEAACALGGGIWSMHFVGMLALRLPVSIGYDALNTLCSVLVSILITGLGLSFVHMGERRLWRTAVSGTLIGLGIVTMHYIGCARSAGTVSSNTGRPDSFSLRHRDSVFDRRGADRLSPPHALAALAGRGAAGHDDLQHALHRHGLHPIPFR